jgi:hypothetical protein
MTQPSDPASWNEHPACRQHLADVQLVHIAWCNEVLADHTPVRFMGCPLDAIWVWHYRRTGYL